MKSKNNPNKIKQAIYFSYISIKKDTIYKKKFDILEVSKDILSNIFIEKEEKEEKEPKKVGVTIEEGQSLAEKFNLKFYETSCKTGVNVEEAFMDLTGQVLEKMGAIKYLN